MFEINGEDSAQNKGNLAQFVCGIAWEGIECGLGD